MKREGESLDGDDKKQRERKGDGENTHDIYARVRTLSLFLHIHRN
jgi:hypothetical protein